MQGLCELRGPGNWCTRPEQCGKRCVMQLGTKCAAAAPQGAVHGAHTGLQGELQMSCRCGAGARSNEITGGLQGVVHPRLPGMVHYKGMPHDPEARGWQAHTWAGERV